MTVTAVPLHQPLPDSVVVGGNLLWTRYRRYPVFSLPWLSGRILLFGGVILLFSLLTLFGTLLSAASVRGALTAAAYTFFGFLLITTAGPAFATAVRHLRLPLARERLLVVLALCTGIGVSYVVDAWASARINEFLIEEMGRGIDVDAMQRQAEQPVVQAASRVINLLTLGLIYGLLGGGAALRAYFFEQRRLAESRHRSELAEVQARRRESELRLAALQAQVEPHFLFNTLASVRALVRQDAARAEATLDALVDYLRTTIPRLREGEAGLRATLGDQIDICGRYLEVMRLRTADRLRYTIEIDDALRAVPYPPLLLITLVENAIKHGIEPRPGAGHVCLRAWQEAGQLCVAVIDDGAGLQPGVGGGVGLANVREQLAARYGARASLQLSGPSTGGARAEVRIPLEGE